MLLKGELLPHYPRPERPIGPRIQVARCVDRVFKFSVYIANPNHTMNCTHRKSAPVAALAFALLLGLSGCTSMAPVNPRLSQANPLEGYRLTLPILPDWVR